MTAAGEALPPLYIISSSAKDELNFQLDPSICEGLPTFKANYAGDTYRDHSSFIVVRHTGSMDTPLWHDLNRHIYLPCFEGKISKEPVRDPITQKLKSGPLIVKTDAGPGRLSDKDGAWNFVLKWLKRAFTFYFHSPTELHVQRKWIRYLKNINQDVTRQFNE